MRRGLTFAAATLHTFWSPTRIGLRGPPVTKVVERCIFKPRPNITPARRLSTTPNSRLYDPLQAEILQLATPRTFAEEAVDAKAMLELWPLHSKLFATSEST